MERDGEGGRRERDFVFHLARQRQQQSITECTGKLIIFRILSEKTINIPTCQNAKIEAGT